MGFEGDERCPGVCQVLNKEGPGQVVPRRLHAGALDPVTVDGIVYGLRNDLAQFVFWYNQALFDQFGYDVPRPGRNIKTSATSSRLSTRATSSAPWGIDPAPTSTTGVHRPRFSRSTAIRSRRHLG